MGCSRCGSIRSSSKLSTAAPPLLAYPWRTRCLVLGKCQSRSERLRQLVNFWTETGWGILPTTAASTPERWLDVWRSKMESSAPSALYRLLCQAQKLGTTFGTRLADSHPDRWRLLRCSILYETTESTVLDPARPLPNIVLWLKDDIQICFENIEPHHPGKGRGTKERVVV